MLGRAPKNGERVPRLIARLSDGTLLTDGSDDIQPDGQTGDAEAKWMQPGLAVRAEFGPDRIPVQVCPRGCTHELAHRYTVSEKTQWWNGRARLHIEFQFETENCTECGSAMAATCARCGRIVRTPVSDRCHACGVPYPWASVRRSTARRTTARAWLPLSTSPGIAASTDNGSNEIGPAVAAKPIYETRVEDGEDIPRVYVLAGDVTELQVDGIISNADTDGRMWTAIASAVKGAAGDDVERESVDKGPFELGQAWETSAGNLEHLDKIVHVAAIDRYGNGGDAEIITHCVTEALKHAHKADLKTLAIPMIGTGKNALSLADWRKAVVPALVEWFEANPGAELTVVLVLFELSDITHVAAEFRDTADSV